MTSWDEKTLQEVAEEYDMSIGYLRYRIAQSSPDYPCPFPIRKFERRWLIDTGSDEFKAFAASYGQSYVVKARREGRLKKRTKPEPAMRPTARIVWR